MIKLGELSDKLVVMSHKAKSFLHDIYGITEEKIAFIHHGIPDMPFIDSSFHKDKFRVEGKKVLLTFGLLSPNKGIETVLQALPAVIEKFPDVVYIILGATHPHVLKTKGEAYRIMLQQIAHNLNISDHVIFQNNFVALRELCDFLGIADIYITPYLEEAQITSGTLVYAMGTGKAVISTPYWYATEMLADSRGKIVPFNQPNAMAEQINELLQNDTQRHTMRKKAYTFTREAIWKEVSQKYLDVFNEVRQDRVRHPRPRHSYVGNIKAITSFDLPEIKLDHLKAMTDDTGMLQHADHTIPNRSHGYCTDDNARAMLVAAMGQKHLPTNGLGLDALTGHYLGFLLFAYNKKTGRFRNFMTYARQWNEDACSEDLHGRAVWCLGKAVAFLENPGHLAMSTVLFKNAIIAAEGFRSPRAVSFCLVGLDAYLERFSGDRNARRIRDVLATRLFTQFSENKTDDWPWAEDTLNHANAKLSHALLVSGHKMKNHQMVKMGIDSLTWLLSIQTTDHHFAPIGCNGWFRKKGKRSGLISRPLKPKLWLRHVPPPIKFPVIGNGLKMPSCVSTGFSVTMI